MLRMFASACFAGRRKWFLFGATALVLLAGAWGAWSLYPIHVYDDFESGGLGFLWSEGRFEPGAVRMQRQSVREGHSAAEITVRSGDIYEPSSPAGIATERAELLEPWWLNARLDRAYRYRFSLYLPADFPIVPTRLVIAQWKQANPPWADCVADGPLLAVRYQNGELFLTQESNSERRQRTVLYSTREEMRGRWLDFRFDIRFSQGEDGRIDGWLNGEPIARYRGQTAYRGGGYLPPCFFRFKTGLYRDFMQENMTIYVDEYRKDELSS
ncbi:MAG: polysaccharide lyase [Solidesulfovibrio sp.]